MAARIERTEAARRDLVERHGVGCGKFKIAGDQALLCGNAVLAAILNFPHPIPIRPYVFFRPLDDGIRLIRVLHGSRDIPAQAGRRMSERPIRHPPRAAGRLGIAEETLSRWLNESQIQSRAMDNLLRLFFTFPVVREALSGEAPLGAEILTPVGG